eukprot:Hpha_TRINITY_DN16229_c2_g8::TRINITY_DN16229_c2_g8_i1::g.14497::m.14497
MGSGHGGLAALPKLGREGLDGVRKCLCSPVVPILIGFVRRQLVFRPVVPHPLAGVDVGLEEVPQYVRLVQVGVDARFDKPRVHLGQSAPVHPRVEVVNGVVPVVEGEEVDCPADEVSGVVPLVLDRRGTSVVLEDVHGDDLVLGVELGEEEDPKVACGRQETEQYLDRVEADGLSQVLPPDGTAQLPLLGHVCGVVLRDLLDGDGGEEKVVEQVPFVAHTLRSHRVLGFVGELVVREVVPRDQRRHRPPVGVRERHHEEGVEEGVGEKGNVDGVVGDRRSEEGEHCAQEAHARPLRQIQIVPPCPCEPSDDEVQSDPQQHPQVAKVTQPQDPVLFHPPTKVQPCTMIR